MTKRNARKGLGFKAFFLLFLLIVCMILFLPSTFLLMVGMLPTAVFYFVDQSEGRNKTFTIGAMNFTGCFPYLLALWRNGSSMEMALDFLQSPVTIIVMYGAAASGHLIDWIVKVIVTNILIEKAKYRLQKIEKIKENMIVRWGQGVQGSQKGNTDEDKQEENAEKAAV